MEKFGGAPLMTVSATYGAPKVEAEVCRIFVTTNIDPKYHWVFPKKFYSIPKIGDCIEAFDGEFRPILKVCMITYLSDGDIRIELTGTYRSHS